MAIHQTWNIRARASACAHSNKDFEDGESIYTAIFESEEDEESFVRKDFSVESWEEIHESLAPFSFWKSTYEAPVPHEDQDVVEESAESLLSRLIEDDEASTENARYILAVMLERKRVLLPTDTQKKGKKKFLIYEHATSGEVFIVLDPKLRLDEIESVQDEVAVLLGGKPRPPQHPEAGSTDDSPEEAEKHENSGEPVAVADSESGTGDAESAAEEA